MAKSIVIDFGLYCIVLIFSFFFNWVSRVLRYKIICENYFNFDKTQKKKKEIDRMYFFKKLVKLFSYFICIDKGKENLNPFLLYMYVLNREKIARI